MLPDGFRIYPSGHEPKVTMDRLVAAVIDHGMAIVARIDHASAATKVGLELRPTEVLLFGNPLVGTQLMQVSQTTGIDLPLKALVWQDQEGRTWLGYNDPGWIATRHGIEAGAQQAVAAMADVLAAIAHVVVDQKPGATP